MVFLMVSYISILLFQYLTRSCLRSPHLFFYSLTHPQILKETVSSVVAPALWRYYSSIQLNLQVSIKKILPLLFSILG